MKKRLLTILSLLLMCTVLSGCAKEQDKMELRTESLEIEYGESISLDPKEYLTNENEDLLNEIVLETTAINEENKEYPAVGEYEVSMTYKDQTEKVKVIVKDTIAPAFKEFIEVAEFNKGDKATEEDYAKFYVIEDLSEVTVTVDDSDVDYKKVGEYKVTITATDESGNTVSKEMTVKIVESGAENETPVKTTTSSSSSSTSTTTTKPSSSSGNSSSNSTASKPSSSSSSSGSSSSSTTKPSSSTGSSSSNSSTSKPSGSTTTKPSSGSTSGSSGSSSTGGTSNSGSSSGSSSSGSGSSSSSGTTKPSESKPEPKPEPTWTMSEAEMIAYAKQCVISFKPTSGYGYVEWADEFNKNNSGWFAPSTVRISMTESEIKAKIKGRVDSTLELSTSQIFDDGQGNIDTNSAYAAKVYFEKVDDSSYKVYCLY